MIVAHDQDNCRIILPWFLSTPPFDSHMSKIKDAGLAEQGEMSYRWAQDHMKILNTALSGLQDSRPLEGVTVSCCLHLTKETSVLLMGLARLGATVSCCPGNPLTTQDDITAFLDSQGIHVYGWNGQTADEYDWCIDQALSHNPSILVDDGADMNIKAHFDTKHDSLNILGATEETTAGVTRIRAVERQNKLKYPIFVVNDAYTKHLFDNRYGTGQSTVDGLLRSVNLLMASKRVVVAGYGWVGRGVAARCSGMNSRVIITEVDPIRALEAHMDGYDVMPMSAAAAQGDIFITTTGMTDVIRREHIDIMQDGAILANVGHFDVEIDTDYLLNRSVSVRQVRPSLDECVLHDGKRICLVGKGRLANLAAAEGHPPEVMALSFSNQLRTVLHILKNHDSLPTKVLTVPDHIDRQVAYDALAAMGVKTDYLNEKQKTYMHSW